MTSLLFYFIYILACLLCQLHKILYQALQAFKLLLVSLKPLLSSYRVSAKSTDFVCVCVSVLIGFLPVCVCFNTFPHYFLLLLLNSSGG